jgi:hypothetical protein
LDRDGGGADIAPAVDRGAFDVINAGNPVGGGRRRGGKPAKT